MFLLLFLSRIVAQLRIEKTILIYYIKVKQTFVLLLGLGVTKMTEQEYLRKHIIELVNNCEELSKLYLARDILTPDEN